MRINPNLSAVVNFGIQGTSASLQSAVQELSTGRRVNMPSDDPYAAAANLQSLAQSAAVDRYTANADAVLSQSHLADSALGNVVSQLTEAVSLGTRGVDGSMSATNRLSVAAQVNAVLQQVIGQANTRYNGNSLFAGTSGASAAFVADSTSATGFTYQGNSSVNSAAIGDNQQVSTSLPGDQVFTHPGADVIGSLAQLVTALQANNTAAIADATAAVRSAIDYVGQQRVILSGSMNQISSQESYLSQETISLTSQQHSLTQVDMSQAITDMTQAQTAHSAILAAAAKILPTSLLDYLK